MTTMAGMAFGETPERVLKRVQQLEDVELPSLPSFSHDLDYDSTSEVDQTEDERSLEQQERSFVQEERSVDQAETHEVDPTTPHPLRQAHFPSTSQTMSDQSDTTDGSPFPPLNTSHSQTPASYGMTTAITSTPISRSGSRSIGRSTRTEVMRSGTRELGNSTKVSSSRWQTPGQMSRSFSGEEILQDEEDLGSERSIPLNDASARMNRSALTGRSDSPIVKRLSVSHVNLDRPRRRVTSGPSQLEALEDIASELQDTSAEAPTSTRSDSPRSTPPPAITERIPSLTRSEASHPDTSGGATTPEGPSRRVAIATPLPHLREGHDIEYSEDVSQVYSVDDEEGPTDPYRHTDNEQSVAPTDSENDTGTYRSPPKNASVSYPQFSTPGIGRNAPMTRGTPMSFAQAQMSTLSTVHDITVAQSTVPSFPFTPTPVGQHSKYENLTTPRAPLDDAERRKSHVLAVLSSTGIPGRTPRAIGKGTPHPLRRVSMAPASESIAEEGASGSQRALSATPGQRSHFSIDAGMQSVNDSFVSIASSADLTSDKRASHLTSRISRGNTSFPNILLPGSISHNSPGGSLRGVADSRVDGIKIHKHLNAMNKQLLESNADLAREAEAWRDEVERLKSHLHDAGVEFEEIDVLAQATDRSDAAPITMRTAMFGSPGNSSGTPIRLERSMSAPSDGEHNHTAILQDMAEKLEGLEDSLAEKDNIISELQERLDSTGQQDVSDNAQLKIEQLTNQLEEAENDRADLHADFAQKTEQHAKRFGEICTGFEEQVRSLEGQLKFAQTEVERLRADRTRVSELSASATVDDKENEWRRQVSSLQDDLDRIRTECAERSSEADAARNEAKRAAQDRDELALQIEDRETRIHDLESAQSEDKEAIAQLEQEVESLRLDLAQAEEELATANRDLEELRQIDAEKEVELDQQHEQIELLSTKMQELENQNAGERQDDEEVQRLHDVIEETNAALADKESELEALRAKSDVDILRQSTSSAGVREVDANSSFVAAMEQRLDEAHREIGKLKHELSATPYRKSNLEMREARIKALEREKGALADRLAAREVSLQNGSMLNAGSPFKASPFVNKALASLKTPKTPGSLKELSWLQSSVGDANEPILRAQLEYLQDELKSANDQLDNNFSRLESAGFGALSLAEKLAKANERISELEDEIRGLSHRNKASLALVSAQRDEENRDHEDHLEDALAEMRQQMEDLKSDLEMERSRLQRDNGRLQDLVSEINLKRTAEVDSFRSELARLEEEADDEVKQLKEDMRVIRDERERLTIDHQDSLARINHLEEELASQLDAYDDLSAQLANQGKNDDAKLELEAKVVLVQTLRSSLRDANAATDQLRLNLREKGDSLRHAESTIASLHRERANITKELLEFETDLQRQRADSEAFGKELKTLKAEQGGSARLREEMAVLQRNYRSAKDTLHQAQQQLAVAVRRASELESWQKQQLKEGVNTAEALAEQKARFKAQSRDLSAQIRYLKAKFTRESTFRNGLSLQKRYLLLMVGGMSLNEQATLKAIASMGHPVPEVKRPKRTLKSIGLAVVSIIRARNIAAQWREEVQMKSNAVSNHQERRKVSGK